MYREPRLCNTACVSMSERDGKDQREGSPKQAYCLCLFARHCWLVVIVARTPFRGEGVAAAILHISDVPIFFACFLRWIRRLFIHICSSIGTRSESQTRFYSATVCVLLLCFFFASFFTCFYRVYLIWMGWVATSSAVFLLFPNGFYFVTTG